MVVLAECDSDNQLIYSSFLYKGCAELLVEENQ